MLRIYTPSLLLVALALAAALAGASVDAKAQQLIYSLGSRAMVSAA